MTTSFEWHRLEGEYTTVGVTEQAISEIGEVVFVELPRVGAVVVAGQEIAVLESTKAAIDLYSPVSGTVTEVNTSLQENTALLNRHPGTLGWLYKIKNVV